jgi:hypothetical protein
VVVYCLMPRQIRHPRPKDDCVARLAQVDAEPIGEVDELLARHYVGPGPRRPAAGELPLRTERLRSLS